MVERKEVEALLSAVDRGDPWWFTKTEMVVIADLCRTWLAVKDAPVGEIVAQWDAGAEIDFDSFITSGSIIFRRVRIVEEVERLDGSGLT